MFGQIILFLLKFYYFIMILIEKANGLISALFIQLLKFDDDGTINIVGSNLDSDDELLLWKKKLQKIPSNLAIIVTQTGSDIDLAEKQLLKIARIIQWAAKLEIRHVTLYEKQGNLKMMSSVLIKQLAKIFPNCLVISNVDSSKSTIKFHSNFKNKSSSGIGTHNKYYDEMELNQNVYQSESELHISFLSEKDGKEGIIQAVKQLYLEHQNINNMLISEEQLDNQLNRLVHPHISDGKLGTDIPFNLEPDLLMVLGDSSFGKSTLGFLPWHIRSTEIHFLPNLSSIQVCDFINSINKYADCEQRVGK